MIQTLLSSAAHGVFSWGGLAVTCITLIVDIFWANYNMTSADKKPLNAAFWSMMIVICGTFSTQIWLDNKWVLVNSAIGAFIGTYLAVRNGKRKADAAKVQAEDPTDQTELSNTNVPVYLVENDG